MAGAHPLKFEVTRCRTSQFARCFLPAQVRMWNDFPTLCLTPERWMGSRVQSTVGCYHELCFLQFSMAQVLVGLRNQFMDNFVFHTWACAAGFYNNNNNNNKALIAACPARCDVCVVSVL